MDWGIVVPVKDLASAKTRLNAQARTRAELALAFAMDTVRAALDSARVAAVVVVTADAAAGAALAPLGVVVLPEPAGSGLNVAARLGAQAVRALQPDLAVGVLVADLPALRGGELGVALAAAAAGPRCSVPDRSGKGTTLVTAIPGLDLELAFGPGSARRHLRAGLLPLVGNHPTLRCDVDTADDLQVAQALGLGPATTALLERGGAAPALPRRSAPTSPP